MAENLFTTIISEVSLHRTIAEITGLLILIAIFLILATKVLKRKKAKIGTILEPRVEKTTTIENVSEPQIQKQVDTEAVSEPQIQKQVDTEAVSEPQIQKQVVTETVSEPQIQKQVVTETVSEPQIQKQVVTETVMEPQIQKQVVIETVSESKIKKQVDTETVLEPLIKKQVVVETILEPQIQKKVDTEAVSEPQIQKQVVTETVSEPQIKKKVDAESVSEPQIQKQVVTETVMEPQIKKQVVTETVSESKIKKQVDTETVLEPLIKKQVVVETILEPQIQKKVVTETVLEPQIERHTTSDIIHKSKENFGDFPLTIMTKNGKNIEYLLNELKRIDTTVSFNLAKWKEKHSKNEEDFMGLYISENEVDTIVQNPHELTEESEPVKKELQTISRDLIKEVETEKSQRLQNLKDLFELDPFEVDALLICLVPELDLQYEKVYSYIQNDVTKKRPTVDLVINLLCKSIEEKLLSRNYFSPESPLIKNHLVYLTGDAQEGGIPLLSRYLKVDERIISYLLGGNEIDHRIQNFSLLIEPKKSFKDLIIVQKERNLFIELINNISSMKVPMFFFHGAYGTGKKMTAEAMCNELKKPLMVVDSRVLIKDESLEKLHIIIREALLQNSPLFIEGFDALLEKDAGINVGSFIQKLDVYQNWIFLSGEFPWMPAGILKNHSFIDHAFPLPSFNCRKQLWDSLLEGNIKGLDLDALSSKFTFSAGQIRDAIFIARNIAMVKTGKYELSMEDLYQGCKAQSNKNLSSLAKNITPRYTWNDIVLPRDLREQLKEVSGHIIHKGKVYADWGFDNKLSLGKGLNVLFSGPSGAGKTMAAEILAKEAGLDMYKIDLSTLVSKYIGETEKNLSKIFYEAQTSNAILFFDEADALFGKRSEVKDSHDRYANIEINYLLQKMEEYEGIVILASNFKSNIDEAFLRRIHFVIEFPLPDDDLREKIWRNIFPKETPLNKDVDYSFLSKFKITGGNIKNIALNAAFLAAGDSGDVKMEHIIRATKREFQKMGKLCTAADFGGYYNLVK